MQYATAIENLLQGFDQCFADFKARRDTFQELADLFSADVGRVPNLLQMEHIDLQCNSVLETQFGEAQKRQT